jgi:lipid A 3-O-deacylase
MKFIGSILAIVALAPAVFAEEITSPGVKYDSVEDVFQAHGKEGSFGVSVLFSPFAASRNRPTYDYAMAVGQLGYMLTGIHGAGPLRGNVELVGELFAGGVFVGHGNYVGGITLWGRYNFVQPDWKIVPYLQLGAGCGATDIDQRVIGQVFQFNLNAAVGMRYFIKHNVALTAEYRFQHLSNANTGIKNLGINAQGAMLGASWFF